MNKIKIVSIMIIAMLVSLTSVSVVSAEEKELLGNIQAEFLSTGGSGVIEPTLNIVQNQTVFINIEEKDGNYSVNTTLLINVTSLGDIPDTILFRGIISYVHLVRADYSKFPALNMGLIHPAIKLGMFLPMKLDFISLAGLNLLGFSTKYIEVPLNYKVNKTVDQIENLTLFVGVCGLLPGEVHSVYGKPTNMFYSLLAGFLPNFVGIEQVNLELKYVYP